MLMLSLGPALVAAIVGLVITLIVPPEGGRDTRTIPALLLAVVSLLLMHFVRLDVDTSWVGFRAGQMFLAAVPALIAAGLATAGTWRRVAAVIALAALVVGAPTTVIDTYNAQDITNFSESPNGPWTVTVTPDETQGLEFLRRVLPPTTVVQMDPLSRERSTWSLIPSFARAPHGRRTSDLALGGRRVRNNASDRRASADG
jgi:hypothetical protein